MQLALEEVARLLSSDGLFIFDINTRLGLDQTQALTVVQDTEDSQTQWSRHWLAPDTLRLVASGKFSDGDAWHHYDEVIDKTVLPVSWLEETLSSTGLTNIIWVADDLVTPLEEPEQHAVAFALVRST